MNELYNAAIDLEDMRSKLERARQDIVLLTGLVRMKQNALIGIDNALSIALQDSEDNRKQSFVFEYKWKNAIDFIKLYGLKKSFHKFLKERNENE